MQRGRHEDLLAAGGLYGELYRTQFAASPVADEAEEPVDEPPSLDADGAESDEGIALLGPEVSEPVTR